MSLQFEGWDCSLYAKENFECDRSGMTRVSSETSHPIAEVALIKAVINLAIEGRTTPKAMTHSLTAEICFLMNTSMNYRKSEASVMLTEEESLIIQLLYLRLPPEQRKEGLSVEEKMFAVRDHLDRLRQTENEHIRS